VSLLARGRPEEALGPIQHGLTVLRSTGQPTDLAHALLHEASVLQTLGQRERSEDVIAEASTLLDSCADPGILPQRLAAIELPQTRRTGPAGDDLTDAELRVLRLFPLRKHGITVSCTAPHSPR
jgi:LuxR family maltose regulon positive regulatory protein